MGESYAVILPLYGEFAAKTTPQMSGAGVTADSLYMSWFAPQPWGTPYTLPSTVFHRFPRKNGVSWSYVVTFDVSITAASPFATLRSDESPDAETTSYCPVWNSWNASSDVPNVFTDVLQPDCFSNGPTQLRSFAVEPSSAYPGHAKIDSDPPFVPPLDDDFEPPLLPHAASTNTSAPTDAPMRTIRCMVPPLL